MNVFGLMRRLLATVCLLSLQPIGYAAEQSGLCLDGFCIGQTIQNSRFDQVAWLVPQNELRKENCTGVGCRPEVAFRGYPYRKQLVLADVLSWRFRMDDYNVLTKDNIAILRFYSYECNPSARGTQGERRFLGFYRSSPSHYLTVVGLRLINDHLTVYRIARQFPYRNQDELVSLARRLREEYGSKILLYDYLSSNAYSEVIRQAKDGWFGRSTLYNPADSSDNAAEIVLIDPRTRALLQSTAMPDSGEIAPVAAKMPPSCTRTLPIQ
jgi:hypothetical protein